MFAGTPQVPPQVSQLLRSIQGEMSREELQSALGLQDRKSFRDRYLKPALAEGLIEMTIPKSEGSRLQVRRVASVNCTYQRVLWILQTRCAG